MKRGSVRKSQSQIVTVWVPNNIHLAIDQAVTLEDSDRSKFVRRAVREKLARMGIMPAGAKVKSPTVA